MARLITSATIIILYAATGLGAPAPKLIPVKLDKVPERSAELRASTFPWDATYRHGTAAQFAELEAKAEALVKEFPERDDVGHIWYTVAEVAGQSGVSKHAALIQKNALKCLEFNRNPLEIPRMYSYLASTVNLSGSEFPKGRRLAAEYLLAGYQQMLVQDLQDKAPELPGVGKIGGLKGIGPDENLARAQHAAQMAARQEAVFIGTQIERRDSLVRQLRDLYKPHPKYHGRNPEGPDELRALALRSLTEKQTDALLKKITE